LKKEAAVGRKEEDRECAVKHALVDVLHEMGCEGIPGKVRGGGPGRKACRGARSGPDEPQADTPAVTRFEHLTLLLGGRADHTIGLVHQDDTLLHHANLVGVGAVEDSLRNRRDARSSAARLGAWTAHVLPSSRKGPAFGARAAYLGSAF